MRLDAGGASDDPLRLAVSVAWLATHTHDSGPARAVPPVAVPVRGGVRRGVRAAGVASKPARVARRTHVFNVLSVFYGGLSFRTITAYLRALFL